MLVFLKMQPTKKHNLYALIGLLIGFYIFYLGVLYVQLQTETHALKKLEHAVQQAKKREQNLVETRRAQALLETQLKSYSNLNLPTAYDLYLAAKLEHITKHLDLSLLSLHWQQPQDFSYHQKLSLELSIQSTFHALGFFIEKVLSLGGLARIESLNISRSENSAYLISRIHIHFLHLKKI